MIFNLLKEDEQRDYWRGKLPDELIERLYDFSGINMIEFNREYMALANKLKQAYIQPIQDDSLKALMEQLLSLIPQNMVEDLVEVLKEYEDIELNDWLFPTPFTKEEEEWFISQAERLGVYGGEDNE